MWHLQKKTKSIYTHFRCGSIAFKRLKDSFKWLKDSAVREHSFSFLSYWDEGPFPLSTPKQAVLQSISCFLKQSSGGGVGGERLDQLWLMFALSAGASTVLRHKGFKKQFWKVGQISTFISDAGRSWLTIGSGSLIFFKSIVLQCRHSLFFTKCILYFHADTEPVWSGLVPESPHTTLSLGRSSITETTTHT